MKHLPIITTDRASCSCKRMHGAYRLASESIGAFTLRAADLHREHMEDVHAGDTEQRGLFEQQQSIFQ